ncbi:hypothetical protein ABZY19_39025 [Streptomyces sp. NPDC006475]|uniref:hypothetical protein n=1 Tax=Streptomyces sp. NPDC006475 TaxID=3155719 RepID=UPI0033AD97F1
MSQKIVSGIVDENGNVISGSGFNVAVVGSGQYEVSFNTPFDDAPATVTTVYRDNGWPQDGSIVWAADQNKVKIVTGSSVGGNMMNRGFSFIFVG